MPGLFEQFGVDTRSQEEILRDNVRRGTEEARLFSLGRRQNFAGEEALQRAGRQVGAGLTNKFGGTSLTPEQERTTAALEQANTRLEASGVEDPVQRATLSQQYIAEELIRSGDERGIALLQDAMSKRNKFMKDEKELEKLGLQTDNARIAGEAAAFNLERGRIKAKRGESAEVYPKGSTDENESVLAFIDDEGNATDGAGNILFPRGKYTTVRPKSPALAGTRAQDFGISSTEAKQIRAHQRTLATQMRLATTMRDAMADAVAGSGTLEILDRGGKATRFVTRLVDTANSIGRTGVKILEGDTQVGSIDGSEASAKAYIKNNKEFFSGITIPDTIRGDERAVERFQAAVVQMAYAKARAAEPGARQLSDTDFKNALNQIGAAASDPEALRQVLFGDIIRGVEDFDLIRDQISPEAYNSIVKGPAQVQFRNEFDKFQTAFSEPFGTAEFPGTGLTNPTTERQAGSPSTAPTAVQEAISSDDQAVLDRILGNQ